MYYSRTLKQSWLDASGQFPVLLLTGPRQIGKTTMLRHICGSERAYISLDDPDMRELANHDPALFLNRYEGSVLIDEIQYAPNLMPYIKMRVDNSSQKGLFWLTGSQQFLMMKGISESLAGRVGILNMLGFSARERSRSGQDFGPFMPDMTSLQARLASAARPDLNEIYKNIWQGSFPALVTGQVSNARLFYSSYLQTYIQRDVRDITNVADENTFLKFVRACAARTGQLLNLSDIAKDTEISVPTAKKWLSILQASFQVVLLMPYHSNLTKRLTKTPKLYFLDTGLCAHLTQWSTPQALEAGAMSGAIFETYVVSEIIKSYWHNGLVPQMYFYRDDDKNEIDLIIEQDQKLYPIEIKKGVSAKKDWIKSFASLKKLNREIGHGVAISLVNAYLPLDANNTAIPVTAI